MLTAEIVSQDHRELLDLFDRLRSLGIPKYHDLAQIVVTGDQSSGKSSVLEAISGLTFPSKDNLCTRFPTELSLRRDDTSSTKVTIIPDDGRTKQEKADLYAFSYDINGANPDLSDVIEAAKKAMGISKTKVFSNDVLSIVAKGPNQPDLMLVDLPGLFVAGDREQPTDAATLVKDMVKHYIRNPKSIVLAVVSAKADINLQIIHQLTQEFDPDGRRTLGLITKPDTLSAGSDSEQSYIDLAKNANVKFTLGWHVLRNRSYETRNSSSDERDREEERFFATGKWAYLDRNIVGVKALRLRLSRVLQQQISQDLPSLLRDVSSNLEKCRQDLNGLGEPRNTLLDKRRHLRHISFGFTMIMKAAVDGHYTSSAFFGPMEERNLPKRLLTNVQGDLRDFSTYMAKHGHAFVDDATEAGSKVGCLTSEQYVIRAKDIMRHNQGRELVDTYSSTVVGEIFRDLSRFWSEIVFSTIESIVERARTTSHLILEHEAKGETMQRLIVRLERSIDELADNLRAKVDELLRPHLQRGPFTLNQELQHKINEQHKQRCDASSVPEELSTLASQLAIDLVNTYYKIALNTLIDNVAMLAVDAELMQKLPSLFDSERIDELTDEEVEELASEGQSTIDERKRLQDKISDLQAASHELRQFRRYTVQPHESAATVTAVTPVAVPALSSNQSTPSVSSRTASPATPKATPTRVRNRKYVRNIPQESPDRPMIYGFESEHALPETKVSGLPFAQYA